MMFYKVGYEDVLLLLSLQWENHERSWSRHKDYFDKSSALQSSVQEVKKYHNQVLLDLFEDDTNAAFAAVKAQFTDLDYFLAHNKSQTMTLFMIRLWAMVN
jgi:aspartate kinase